MILGARSGRGGVAVPLVLVLAGVTACSGGSGGNPPPSFSYSPYTGAVTPSATASTTSPAVSPGSSPASPTVPVIPVLPEAAKKATGPGAEAFFKYFLALYTASYAALDADHLAAISLPTCKFCTSAVNDIRAAKKAGNRPVGGEVTPIVVIAAPGDPKVGVLINAAIRQAASITYDPAGAPISSAAAHPQTGVDAAVRWVGGKWVVAVVVVK